MPPENSDAKPILEYSFLKVFANDRTIDSDELAFLEKLALRDGSVDEKEKEVLGNIFSRVNQSSTTPEVWAEIQRFKSKYQIS